MLPCNTPRRLAALASAALVGVITLVPAADATKQATRALDEANAAAAARAERHSPEQRRVVKKLKVAADASWAAAAEAEETETATLKRFVAEAAKEAEGRKADERAAVASKVSRSADRTRPGTGGVTSPYGRRVHPLTGVEKLHSGTDFEVGDGKAYAADSGKVEAVEYDGGYGNMVTIVHGGGVQTRYAHLAEVTVEVGQRVDAGLVVGRIGSTGNSTGPHLHFEVLVDGEFIDPARWLAR